MRSKAGPKAQWGDTEHLLAIIGDRLEAANYLFASANAGKGKKPAKPEPLPRPGDAVKDTSRRTQLPSREVARRLVDMQRKGVTSGRS